MATRNLVDAMILGLDRGIIDLCGGGCGEWWEQLEATCRATIKLSSERSSVDDDNTGKRSRVTLAPRPFNTNPFNGGSSGQTKP